MNLLNILLKSLLADASLSALAKKTGLSGAVLKKLLPLAIPLLLKALTNNAASQNGVQSLLGALTQHTSTKSMPEQIAEADLEDGGKILGHILGGSAASELNGLAAQTGLSTAQVSTALSGIAPALLSGLSAATHGNAASAGKVDLSDGLDLGNVMAMLGGTSQSASPVGGLLGSLLGGQSSASPMGGLLGSLLGSGVQENDNSLNGNALLGALLGAMK